MLPVPPNSTIVPEEVWPSPQAIVALWMSLIPRSVNVVDGNATVLELKDRSGPASTSGATLFTISDNVPTPSLKPAGSSMWKAQTPSGLAVARTASIERGENAAPKPFKDREAPLSTVVL